MASVDITPSSKDAVINQGSFPDTNFGTRGNNAVGTAVLASGNDRTLIAFSLSSIPAGSTINSAILKQTVQTGKYYTTVTVTAYRITADWAEGTVTWNNQPAHDATDRGNVSVTGTGQYSITITTLVQEWFAGTYSNYGVKLLSSTEGTGTLTGHEQASNDNATSGDRPILTVDYTPPKFGGTMSMMGV